MQLTARALFLVRARQLRKPQRRHHVVIHAGAEERRRGILAHMGQQIVLRRKSIALFRIAVNVLPRNDGNDLVVLHRHGGVNQPQRARRTVHRVDLVGRVALKFHGLVAKAQRFYAAEVAAGRETRHGDLLRVDAVLRGVIAHIAHSTLAVEVHQRRTVGIAAVPEHKRADTRVVEHRRDLRALAVHRLCEVRAARTEDHAAVAVLNEIRNKDRHVGVGLLGIAVLHLLVPDHEVVAAQVAQLRCALVPDAGVFREHVLHGEARVDVHHVAFARAGIAGDHFPPDGECFFAFQSHVTPPQPNS